MAHLIPDKLRGQPGSPLHLFRKVLKRLPDDFTAWFSITAEGEELPHVFLVWRQCYGFLIQVAETSQELAESALQGRLFASEQVIRPEELGRDESAVLARFVDEACRTFGPLAGDLAVRRLVVFPNVAESTIDEVVLHRGRDEVSYLGLHQLDAAQFERRLQAMAEAALPEPGLVHLRRCFTPESVVPVEFDARRPIDRRTAATLGGGFLDFDQEWCVKNDLELLPEQEEQVTGGEGRTRLVTGVAGSGKSLVLLYRAMLAARLHPQARVLVLTHNRPLRNELERRSGRLAARPANLTWSTFFQWAVRCLGPRDGEIWNPAKTQSAVAEMKDEFPALAELSASYLTDEIGWIKDHRLIRRESYLAADRAGRGTRLSAAQREEVWELVAKYQRLLQLAKATDWHGVALAFHRAAVEEGRLGFPLYDAVFIDEAQFFAKAWFEVVNAALKPGGHLFLAADPTQGFLRRRQSWIAAGIDVRGRTTRLSHSYRNTRSILAFARGFYESRRRAHDDEDGFNLPDDSILAGIPEEGEAPTVLVVPSVQDEIARAVNEAVALHEAGLPPGSLLLLHADSRSEWALRAALEAKLGLEQVHDLKDGPMPEKAFCAVTTLNAATGLEAPVVMLLGMDSLLEREEDPRLAEDERAELRRDHTRQLYMGFTRAGRRLVVTRIGRAGGEDPGLALGVSWDRR